MRRRLAIFGAFLALLAAVCLVLTLLLVGSTAGDGGALLLGGAAALALGLLLGAAAAAPLLRRLETLTAATHSLGSGNLGARVGPMAHEQDEFGQLAQAFDEMAERVAGQMSLAAHERNRLAAALNSSVDAVAALNADGRVVFANKALERLFDKQNADIVGHPFFWLLADQEVLDAVRASRELGRGNICIIQRPGRQFWQVTTTAIAGGGEWAVLVVFHDLTEVKRVELTRRDFIANVSHELRTPLAGIKSVVEILADGALSEPALADDFLRRADAEIDRLVQLVEELLELSRIESGEVPLSVAPADAAALLSEVVERLTPQAERKRLRLGLELPAGPLDVALDAARIERAVVNLVHNAIKFTPEEGLVRVRASLQDPFLVIEVSDTGIGIAPEDVGRVFERFYKTDQSRAGSGSGLGLALVKHAVESHGGHVELESRLGSGSTFRLYIPARRDTVPAV